MRLLNLDVENYGLYSSEHFDFGAGASGFCLIHGRNEAGKTTLLQLLREVLFGFPARTPYDFGYNGDVAAKFRAELRSGERIRVRRRKGTKNTFAGTIEPADGRGGSAPIDEAMFDRILAAGSELYGNVFAFSLDELRSGERSLAEAGVTEALFGGGAGGLTRFCRLRDRIEAEHRDLFKKTGKKPRINDLLGRLRDARGMLREKSVDPRDFDRINAERTEAESEVERLRERCDEVRGKLRLLERIERGLPIWSRLVVLREDLQRLALPEGFPVDDVERFERLRERIETVEADIARLEGELTVGEDGGGSRSRVDDETLLNLEPRIRSLGEDVGRVRRMLDDLPRRREEARTIMERVERRTRELEPAWTVDDLDRFATSTSDRALIDDLAEQDRDLEKREATEAAQRRELQTRLERVRRQLEQLEPNPRLPGLERLLAGVEEFRRDRTQRSEIERELASLERSCEGRRTALERHVGKQLSAESELPVPLAAVVEEFSVRLRTTEESVGRERQRVTEQAEERDRLVEAIGALNVPGAPPSADDLRAAREARVSAWTELRARIENGEAIESARFETYERTIATADGVADERYAHADELARREQLEADLARCERRLAQAGGRLSDSEVRREAELIEWRELWATSEFEPLAPTAMREWLTGYSAWRSDESRRAELAAEAERLANATAGFERQLTRGYPDTRNVAEALDAAIRERDTARETERRRQGLEAELPEIEARLRDVDEASAALAAERGEWDSRRRETLRKLGLPEDWRVAPTRKVLGDVMQLLSDRTDAAGLERRVAEMQGEIDEYEKRVAGVVAGLPDGGTEFADSPVLETVNRLVAACDEVRNRRAARDAVEQSRSRTTERLQGLVAERTQLSKESSDLIADSGVGGAAEFGRFVEVTRERRELIGRITETERELRMSFDGADLEICEAELAGADPDAIVGRIGELREDLAGRERERDAAREALGAIKDRLKALDLDNDSAEVAATIEGHRAELAAAVDEWAPRVLVEELINRALERFRRDNQPRMLRDVGRLFERMTGGRYVGLQTKLDAEETLLVQHADGTLKEPAALSTGAREQLYLAIRLAYVLQYCGASEPLPIVMDDVLVNFDEDRCRRTLDVLAEVSERAQILFLTCHQHVVDLAREIVPDHHAIELTPTGPICRPAGRIETPPRRERVEAAIVEPASERTPSRRRPAEPPDDSHPTLFPGE